MKRRNIALLGLLACLVILGGLLWVHFERQRQVDPVSPTIDGRDEVSKGPQGIEGLSSEEPGASGGERTNERNDERGEQRSQTEPGGRAGVDGGVADRSGRRERRGVEVLAAAAPAGESAKADAAEEVREEAGDAVLEGTVVDIGFEAVVGAKVIATRPGSGTALQTTSGGEGHFSFDGIAAGIYWLEASKGKALGRAGPVPVAGDQTPSVTIMLGADSFIAGKVLDTETRTAVPGIRLRAWDGGAGRSNEGYSDESGRFRIPVPSPGIYRLHSRGNLEHVDGDLTLTIELAKGESREDVVYFIKRGIRLQGTVTRNDEGVPDATVMLVDLLNDQGGSKGETMSDAEGRFVFSGKKPGGKYVARAVHPVHGFGESAPVMTNPAGAQGRLDVHLRPGQTVRGRLHTSDGSGVAGVPVWLIKEDGQPWRPIPGTRVASATDGTFAMQNVPSGAWQFIVVTAKTTRLRSMGFKVSDGEETEPVDIDLGPGVEGFIEGRVMSPEGDALPKVEVIAYPDIMQLSGVIYTDAEGYYRIDGLGPAQTYTVWARGYNQGRFRKSRSDVPVNSSGVDFVLGKMASISGRVTDADTGAPVQSFHVTGKLIDKDFESPDGRFIIDDIQVSEVIFRFSAAGYMTAVYDPGGVPEGGAIEDVEVTLGVPGWIEGRVYAAATGDSIQGARVKLLISGVLPVSMIEREFFWDASDPYTDAAGRFILTAHPVGQPNSFVVAYADHIPVVIKDTLERKFDIAMEQAPE